MEVARYAYYNGNDLDLEVVFLLCLIMACFNGSYMLCMLVIVSRVLLYVEYLHYMSCRHLLPLYVVSSTNCPLVFLVYPMALMMSGLWCWGLLCLGRRSVGIMVGCRVFALSFCSPSWVASRACNVVSSCGVVISIFIWVYFSFMFLFPSRSMLTISHLPPLRFSSCSSSSLNVLLCLDVHNLALYLQPPRRCVLVRGWLHLVHNIGPCELCFFLHW